MPLTPRESLSEVLFTGSHYTTNCTINVIVTVVINVLVDIYMLRAKPFPAKLINDETFGEIVIFACITAAITVLMGRDLRKRVVEEKVRPVSREALRGNHVLRTFFFSIGITNEKLHFAAFILNVAVIPAMVIAYLLVQYACDYPISHPADCSAKLPEHLQFKAIWKGVISACAFTMNYLAVHNATQAGLAKAKKDD